MNEGAAHARRFGGTVLTKGRAASPGPSRSVSVVRLRSGCMTRPRRPRFGGRLVLRRHQMEHLDA